MKEDSSNIATELICNQHHKQIKYLCLNPQCTQPFCQQCLNNHTLGHEKMGTKPMFKQVNDLRKQTLQLIQNFVKESQTQNTQMDSIDNLQIQNKSNGLLTQLQNHIKLAKAKCLQMVERKFLQHQQWLRETIQKENKRLSKQFKLPSKQEHISKKKQFIKKFENVDKVSKDQFVHMYATIKSNIIEIFNLESVISFQLQSCQKVADIHFAQIQKHNESCLEQFQTKLKNILGYLQGNNQGSQTDRPKNSKSCLKKSTQLQQNAKLVKWAWPVKESVNKQQIPNTNSVRTNINLGHEKKQVLKPIHMNNQHHQTQRYFSPNIQNAKKFFYNHRADQSQQHHINFQKVSHHVNHQSGFAYQQNRPTVFIRNEDTSKMSFTFPVPGMK